MSDQRSPVRPRRPDLTPVQRPAWWTIAVAAAVAVMGAVVVFVVLAWLLGLPVRVSGSNPHEVEQRKILVEVFKGALGLAAGLGAVVALALSYRRHRIEESQSHRDDQRLFTERFQSAAEQLGHEQPAVRLAGVHALARLADDWEEQRQMCIDVLCAYVRLPPAVVDGSTGPSDPKTAGERPITPRAELEVRQTIVRLIADHLRVDPDDSTRISWRGHALDFTGALFDGTFSFSGAEFSGGLVSFSDAKFSGGRVSFSGARFSGGTVNFSGATFSGGTVDFTQAKFVSGAVRFNFAIFCGGSIYFRSAAFSGAEIEFLGATFSDSTIRFKGATFAAGSVSFEAATFTGGTLGFISATFSGSKINFSSATFTAGNVVFKGAMFSAGTVRFPRAKFSGSTVNFEGVTFSGSAVDFRSPSGWSCPPTFDAWEKVPTGVRLPEL